MRTGRFDNLFADAAPRPYWLDANAAPEPCPPVAGEVERDLAIVGGGFTGLWAALIAKERDPGPRDHPRGGRARRVRRQRSQRRTSPSTRSPTACATASRATRRTSCAAPARRPRVVHGADGVTLARHGIDARYEANGVLWIATEPYQLDEIDEEIELIRHFGGEARPLDAAATRAEIESPLALGAVWHRDGGGLLDPVALAYGLRRAVLGIGVRICERSPVAALGTEGARVVLECPGGRVRAPRRARDERLSAAPALGAPAHAAGLRLRADDRAAHGRAAAPPSAGRNRQGMTDLGNQFHYYRLTRRRPHPLRRLRRDLPLRRNGVGAAATRSARDVRAYSPSTSSTTFPQLDGIRFTHRWGGAIDTCTRFCGVLRHGARRPRGLRRRLHRARRRRHAFRRRGHARSRRRRTTPTLTRLPIVRKRPLHVPARAAALAGIKLTRWALDRADRNEGRRSL